MSHLGDLERAIWNLHQAEARYVESVSVTETLWGETVWDGIVEVFRLTGHPKTDRVYAWSCETDDPKNPKRYVTVLHIPPVVSPETAVRAALIQESRERDRAKETSETRQYGYIFRGGIPPCLSIRNRIVGSIQHFSTERLFAALGVFRQAFTGAISASPESRAPRHDAFRRGLLDFCLPG